MGLLTDEIKRPQSPRRIFFGFAVALDSLFIAYAQTEKVANAADVRAAINGLFQQLENPSNYNPSDFSHQVRKVGSLLR